MRYTWIHAINEPRNFSKDKTATGSVAEMIAPKSNVTKSGISSPVNWNAHYPTKPMKKVEISKPIIANMLMANLFSWILRILML